MLSAAIHKRLASGFALDVETRLDAGVTILFGASGSGKTTLLRCLAGLVQPDSGSISIGDNPVYDPSAGIVVPARERRIGYVFQNLALFPHLTAAENIEYGLTHLSAAERSARSRAIADSFRIGSLLGRRPGQISGGEQQRVALARSLVTEPRLLLLDEPLSALDQATRLHIISDLRAWHFEHRIPILYVTHSHSEAFALGERVLLLQKGRIVADGTPYQVLGTPSRESIAQLAGFENILDGRISALHPDRGTMDCRLSERTDLEIPLSDIAAGSPVRIAIRAGDILLATERPRGLSARNVLPGRIVSLRREGTMVIAGIDAAPVFEAHLTLGALESLALEAGSEVWLVIKTHSCHLVDADPGGQLH